MASNGKPQSERYVFSLRSNGAAGEAGRRFGVQDKARIASARTASAQPAPETKFTRVRPVDRSRTRSPNLNVQKSRTEKLTTWVNPLVKSRFQQLADQEGLSLSATIAAFLEQALQEHVDLKYSALLPPIIEAAIEKRMRARDSRLAWLLGRVAFDTGQTKSLVTNILGKQSGMTEETLKNILAMSQRTAKGNITRKTPQLTELMEALEKWLAEEQEKEPGN